jgi:hypothetical protein
MNEEIDLLIVRFKREKEIFVEIPEYNLPAQIINAINASEKRNIDRLIRVLNILKENT